MRMLKSFILVLSLSSLGSAATITVNSTPESKTLVKGERITLPIDIEMSNTSEALGSYTASLKWNPNVLEYKGYFNGETDGFIHAAVNEEKIGDGELVFAAANPQGARGTINILNVYFNVIGNKGDSPDLDMNFSAMASAHTFKNLLPFIKDITTGVNDLKETALDFQLQQNFPNPFNPSTNIPYQLSKPALVQLSVFNTLGQEVIQLLDEQKSAGTFSVSWNGKDVNGQPVPAGIYIYELKADTFKQKKKMLLIK